MASERLGRQTKAIMMYLDERIELDGALKAVYKPEKINDCYSYIRELARKMAVNGCAMIEDSQVFKWARDFYLEELPERERKAKEKKTEAVQDVQELEENDGDEIGESAPVTAGKWTEENLCFDF